MKVLAILMNDILFVDFMEDYQLRKETLENYLYLPGYRMSKFEKFKKCKNRLILSVLLTFYP